MSLGLTPSQTVGPFLSIGLPWSDGPHAVREGGIRISGRVYDGEGTALPDALVETWSPHPPAFARCPTDDDGRWFVQVPRPEDPYLGVSVFARGMLNRVVTRIYLDAELVPDAVPAGRRDTLVARPAGEDTFTFDIRLQGEGETVFFAV
jgi:protocatechuate 3,4-dioxygenase alpha subunit